MALRSWTVMRRGVVWRLSSCSASLTPRPWPPHVQKGVAHEEQPLYVETGHLQGGAMPMLPLPRDDANLFDIRDVDGPGVPRFDPAVHLALEPPAYVERVPREALIYLSHISLKLHESCTTNMTMTRDRAHLAETCMRASPYNNRCLPKFDRVSCDDVAQPQEDATGGVPKVTDNRGSALAFTAPFRFLSDAGVAAMRRVLELHSPKKTHRSYQHRGLWHFSPFVRALLSDPSVLAHFSALVGEPVHPHHLLMDAAFANVSRENETGVVAGTSDPWHFDSCTYVAVTLLSEPMVGGDLQVVRRTRDDALHRIAETKNRWDDADEEIVTVDYSSPGKCVLVQGSQVVHRVTPVEHSPTGAPRIALGIGLVPSSPFRWDKTNLDTFANYDGLDVAGFEFYRLKSHALGHALIELARLTPSSAAIDQVHGGRRRLADRLRAVATELDRVANLVETDVLPAADFVGFVDESQLAAISSSSSADKDGNNSN